MLQQLVFILILNSLNNNLVMHVLAPMFSYLLKQSKLVSLLQPLPLTE